MRSLKESLFTDNVKNKIVPEKLAYVIKKFFGDGVALCKDHQGSYEWYEVNPSTMNIKDIKHLNTRILNYCKKIDGLNIKEDKIPLFNSPIAYYIGDDDYWIALKVAGKYFKGIRVSKKFYECGALPKDQKGVTQRGWDEWQRQRL